HCQLFSLYHSSSTPLSSTFFVLRTPPPPTSTLFPYTTLFRSNFANAAKQFNVFNPANGFKKLGIFYSDCQPEVIQAMLAVRVEEDRKSTRLNSSHLGISYAVFCLKKKTRKSRRRVPEDGQAPA